MRQSRGTSVIQLETSTKAEQSISFTIFALSWPHSRGLHKWKNARYVASSLNRPIHHCNQLAPNLNASSHMRNESKKKKANAKSKQCANESSQSVTGDETCNKHLTHTSESETSTDLASVVTNRSSANMMRVTSTRWVLIRTWGLMRTIVTASVSSATNTNTATSSNTRCDSLTESGQFNTITFIKLKTTLWDYRLTK